MKNFSLRRSLIALTFVLASVFTVSPTALAAPKIEWRVNELEVLLRPTQGTPIFAFFTSSESIDQVTLEVVPALENFVTVSPATIENVQAGVVNTVTLNFFVPAGTEPGTYEGVLHVRSGKRTVARPLKISLIVQPPLPGILLGTDLPTRNTSAEIAVFHQQFLAQGFTLTSPVHISTINLQMSGFGVDQFTLWVTNSIGPGTTQANVLLQTNLTFPNTGGGISGATVAAPVDLDLAPGNYFIVLSSAQQNFLQGWMLANVALPSTVGSVGTWNFTFGGNLNVAFPPASTFQPIGSRPGAFQLLGFVE